MPYVLTPHAPARSVPQIGVSNLLRQPMTLLALLFCATLMAWFCLQPMPPLQDYGEWVFQGWAMARILAGDAALHARFAINAFPVPNMAAQWLLALLTSVGGPFLAAKALIAGYCIASTAVCWLAAKSASAARPHGIFVCLLSLVAFNACFWHGYINYQLGLVLLLWYIQASRRRHFSPIALLGVSLLLYACHASCWIAFTLLVATHYRQPQRLRTFAALLPTTALFAAYLVRSHEASGGAARHSMGVLSFVAYKCYTVAKSGPFHNLVDARGIAANTTHALYYCGILLNLAFAFGLVLCLAWGVRQVWSADTTRRLLPFWCVLFLLFALMPSDLREVVNLGERFLYILLMSMLLTVGDSVGIRRLGWITLGGFLLTALQIPRASLAGWNAQEALAHEPETTGRAYSSDGLFSHRLYQNDERRIELRDNRTDFKPLLFDTSVLRERDPNRRRYPATPTAAP